MERTVETEVAVVGSGAAGATIARELSRRGVRIALIEKGPDWEWPLGHFIAYRTLYNIHRSKERVIIRRGVCTGGSPGVPLVLILVSLARWFARTLPLS